MIKRIGWVFLGLTALLSLFWHWLHSAANVRVNAERWKRYPLQVHFIDVGHGDSILVICEGRAMLVDAGMPFWSKTVRKYMRLCGVESLDYLICTHEHWDHAGGMRGVAENIPFSQAYAPAERAECAAKSYFNGFAAAVREKGLPLRRPDFGETWKLGGAEVQVVGPVSYEPAPSHVENNHSLVLRITYGDNSLLLLGDSEKYAHEAMLKSGLELKSDVVKVGHHGIRQDKEFYEAVAAKYAVLTGAKMSRKRSADIEEFLRGAGTELWLIRETGSVVCAGDGHEWTVGKSGE